jgi:ABC-type multidrug transport system ATPase subunit
VRASFLGLPANAAIGMTGTVLDIGNFRVAAGEIVALLGPNGAARRR